MASSGPLGTPLGALFGPLGGLLVNSSAILGAWRAVGRLSWAAWERLGPFVCSLGGSWGRLGPSWAVSGAPREARGRGTGSATEMFRRCGTPGPGGGVFVYIIYGKPRPCDLPCAFPFVVLDQLGWRLRLPGHPVGSEANSLALQALPFAWHCHSAAHIYRQI